MVQSVQSKKVDFLICGAQKSGTSTLAHYLRQQPQIKLPGGEIHFFDDENLDWEKPNYAKYHEHFDMDRNNRIWGESTPIYMYWDRCCERIAKYNPTMKIICCLRNPVDRAYSQWNMEISRRRETHSFEEAINSEMAEMKINNKQDRVRSYIRRGLYAQQIHRLLSTFGKNNVKIFRYEDLINDANKIVGEAISFLRLNEATKVIESKKRAGVYSQAIKHDTRKQLTQYYCNEIKKLENMLGWNCENWRADQ